jgi:hypothetical protein
MTKDDFLMKVPDHIMHKSSWRYAHREIQKRRDSQQRYYEANKEEVKRKRREHYAANKDRIKAQRLARLASRNIEQPSV